MWKCCVRTAAAAVIFLGAADAGAALRVATYNVDDDTTDYTASHLDNIVQAIKDMAGYKLAGNSQPLDVISLQELAYASPTKGVPSTTLSAVVAGLNSFYGAGTYAYDTTIGKTTGNSTGNGPNGLIYRVSTVGVSAVKQVGTPDGSGEARAPLRYTLTAKGYSANNTFYLYSEHTKALGDSDSALRRTYEMDAVRADADTLGSTAHVLFTGDFNLTGGSSEAGYRDLTAAAGTTLSTNGDPNSSAANIIAGTGRAYDALTSTFSGSSSAYLKYYTDADDKLAGRLDLQLMTANTLANSAANGLRLINSTMTAFGNSYYTAAGVLASVNSVGGSINNAANAVTATTGYTAAMLSNLLNSSDHLPVLADYTIVVPEPGVLAIFGAAILLGRRRPDGRVRRALGQESH